MKKASAKNILFMMSGSIAAYKSCHVLSRLKQAGHAIEVVATPSALKFVGEATIEGLTGRPVHKAMFGTGAHMSHINLMRWADLAIVCPATANTIAKLAHGIGDDLITTLFLAHDFTKPWLIAPAMNTKMYHHPATRNSVDRLRAMGCEILETASGVLACGEIGDGKLLDPDLLLIEVLSRLEKLPPRSEVTPPVTAHVAKSPRKILITSGGTIEPIDPVRAITNTSTGKTGAQIAEAFLGLGHEVRLLAAESSVQPDVDSLGARNRFSLRTFRTFSDLATALREDLQAQVFDLVIHAAAVSDYSLVDGPSTKKVDSQDEIVLRLKKNPKLLGSIRSWSKNPSLKVVAFKLTTGLSDSQKRERVLKLVQDSHPDFIVSNDLSEWPKWTLWKSESSDSASATPVEISSDREALGFRLEAELPRGAQ